MRLPRTQATYTPPDLGNFIIDDLNVTAPASNVIVVRYTLEAPGEAQFGKLLSSHPQPRISVFQWDPIEKDWKIISHANYNNAVALLCNPGSAKSADAAPPGRVSSANDSATTALATRMLEDFQSLLLNGTTQRGTSPQAQIQYADGSGQTGERDLGLPARARVPKERGEPAVVKANGTSLSRVVATRHRDVMVVTYDTHHEGLTRGGAPLATPSQRLITFLQDRGPLAGNWSMIALASYAYDPTQEGLGNASCVDAAKGNSSNSSSGGGGGGAASSGAGGRDGRGRAAAAGAALAAVAALLLAL